MTATRLPEAWFWSHDIRPDQIGSLLTPGMRLRRLSSYGSGERRRFAALVYQEPGPDRTYGLDLDEDALVLGERRGRPVAITVGITAGQGGERPRFTVVLSDEPGPPSRVRVDLDEAGVQALLDGRHRILDFATYPGDGARRYAVILEERAATSWFLTGLTADRLDASLRELAAVPVRLREYGDNGHRVLAAVAEPAAPATRCAWYAGLGADKVARTLDDNDACPVDLDATRDERGVRFTVVMHRDGR